MSDILVDLTGGVAEEFDLKSPEVTKSIEMN